MDDIESFLNDENINCENYDFSNSTSQNQKYDLQSVSETEKIPEMPIPTPINISTKTKTFTFNKTFDIFDIFWKINIIPYYLQDENIIKKQLRIRSYSQETTNMQNEFIEREKEKGYFTNIYIQTDIDHNNLIYSNTPQNNDENNDENNNETNDKTIKLNDDEKYKNAKNKEIEEANDKEREANISKKIKNKYVFTRTITVGLCKKEALKTNIVSKNTNSKRKLKKAKKGGTFYNSFAIWFRILFCNQYQEIHIKIFNTGKIEIPGIKEFEVEQKILTKLKYFLQIITQNNDLEYLNPNGSLVLINSSFHFHYQIKKNVLAAIITEIYGWYVSNDTNSYPGVRCVYFYDEKLPKNKQTGQPSQEFIEEFKRLSKKKSLKDFIKKNKINYKLITIIFFSTGSCIINGTFSDEILYFIYDKLCEIFKLYFANIYLQPFVEPLKPKHKNKIRMVYFQSN